VNFHCANCGTLGLAQLPMMQAATTAVRGRVHDAVPDQFLAVKALMEERQTGWNTYDFTYCHEIYSRGWARCKHGCQGLLTVQLNSVSLWSSVEAESAEELMRLSTLVAGDRHSRETVSELPPEPDIQNDYVGPPGNVTEATSTGYLITTPRSSLGKTKVTPSFGLGARKAAAWRSRLVPGCFGERCWCRMLIQCVGA